MRVCENCFSNDEIRNYIRELDGEESVCECCGTKCRTVDLEELYDFLSSLDYLYEKSEGSTDSFVDRICTDWDIFASKESAGKILEAAYQMGIIGFGPDAGVEECETLRNCKNQWETLKQEVKLKTRFFSDLTTFNWSEYITPNDVIKGGECFYRARVVPQGKEGLGKSDMSCPPPGLATPGRANPLGIPYLYLSEDRITTLYEIRGVYLDRVAIGKFRIKRDLNIVNFDVPVNLFYDYNQTDSIMDMIEAVKKSRLTDLISRDLSRPLRRFDTDLEYIPTQLICEFCRLNKADGIRFRSSLYPEGENLVLFDPSDAECVDVEIHEISKITIESRVK